MLVDGMWAPSQADVQAFLHRFTNCVLATVGVNGWPQGATVAFSETDQLELVFGTAVTSRKFSNLLREPRVGVTVTDDITRLTVQYRGTARRLTPTDLDRYADAHLDKLPGTRPFWDLPDQAYFLIRPAEIRFTNCGVVPWRVSVLAF
jgi:hypothetical protein